MYREAPVLEIDPQARSVARALWWIVGARMAWIASDFALRLLAMESARGPAAVVPFCLISVEVVALAWIARAEIARTARTLARVALVVSALQACSWLVVLLPIAPAGVEVASTLRFIGSLAPELWFAVPIALAGVASRIAATMPRWLRRTIALLVAMSVMLESLPAHIDEVSLGFAPPFARLSQWVLFVAPLTALVAAAVSLHRTPALPLAQPLAAAERATQRGINRFAYAIALHSVATCTAVGGTARLVFVRTSPLLHGGIAQFTLIPLVQAFASGLMIAAATTLSANAPAPLARAARRARAFAVAGLVTALILVGAVRASFGGGDASADTATILFGVFELMPMAAAWQLARGMRALTDETRWTLLRKRVAFGLAGESIAALVVLLFAYLSLHVETSALPSPMFVHLVTLGAIGIGLAGASALMFVLDEAKAAGNRRGSVDQWPT